MDAELFKNEIRTKAKAKIRELRKVGTVAMSADNLWMIIRLDATHGPRGTNAAYFAKEMYREVISERGFSKFVF